MTAAGGAEVPPRLARFAVEWLRAVGDTSFVPLEPTEKAHLFGSWTRRLVEALDGEVDRQAAYDIGVDMVRADYSEGETLASTVGIIDRLLRAELGLADNDGAQRLRAVLEGLAAGYARTVRDRALDEQEELRVAALQASHEATRKLREERERAAHAAVHDALTGLPNRVYLARELDRHLASASAGSRVGLCLLGLDRFQLVNDSRGHAVGDQLLISVARRLRAFAAECGHLVARMEGDGFALLLTDTTCPDDAAKVADRALAVLRRPIFIDGVEQPALASAGVVERPTAGADAADLLRAADITLHWAKADGRDRWCMFDEARNARDIARYRLTAALPAALRDEQFFLKYQPLVALPGRELIGVEALVRWKHPRLGELPPGRFVGLAEDTGLMVPLGLHILESACEEAVGWHAVGPHPPLVSVNLSVCQVRAPGFAAEVLEILDRTGLPPDKLQLEITERAALSTDIESLDGLRSLADRGVVLALDDFGTGHANLAYLRDLPIKELKIAGQFAGGVSAGDDADEAIVKGLIDLAHRLGLTVTAEGVESEEAAAWLVEAGCDHAQGFLFDKPMVADGITQKLSEGRG